jgi:F0F1-type ATP synthase membrane subunit b/b'
MNWWQQPFVQVALPIIVTFAIATWFQNKRMDELSKRLDDFRDAIGKRLDAIERRLERIENLLSDHDRRITALEERTSHWRS